MSTVQLQGEIMHKINLLSATLIGVTCMIGSGWLFAPMIAAKLAGNYAFLAWIISALFIMLIAFCFTHGFIKYPVRGITAKICSLTHNRSFGLPFAFVNWFGIIACVATEAQASTQYLSFYLGNHFAVNGTLTLYGKAVGIVLLLLFLLVNYYGIKFMSRINNIVTILKIATPFIVMIALVIASFTLGNFHLPQSTPQYGISSSIFAMIGAGMIYSFNGFQTIGAFASELKNPKRTIPLALFLSVSVTLVFYLILQFTFMSAIPASYLAAQGWLGLHFNAPMIDLAGILGLHLMSIILILNSVIAPSATGYTYLGASSRMLVGMAQVRQAPKFLDNISPTRGFSKPSMLINLIIAVFFFLNSSGWATLMVVVTVFNVISYMSGPISMAALRKNFMLGWIAFILICLLLNTATRDGIFISNVALSFVAIMFLLSSLKDRLFKQIIILLPFYILMWGNYLFHEIYITIVLGSLFYFFATSKWFINYCQESENTGSNAYVKRANTAL